MSWQQDRIRNLENQLTIRVGLIGEIEQQLIFKEDPIERHNLKRKLQKLNEGIVRNQQEISELKKELDNENKKIFLDEAKM